MKTTGWKGLMVMVLLAAWECSASPAWAQWATPASSAAMSIESAHLMQPEELVRLLQVSKGDKPLVLQIGPHTLFAQAHVPGSEYMGAGSSEEGRAQIRQRLKAVAHNRLVVLYCGCCPWRVCPNVAPALQQVRALGFTNVKVLYIASNFGADWVDKGYPTAKGER